jgi:cytochrome c556
MFKHTRRALGAALLAGLVAGTAAADPKAGLWRPVLSDAEFAAMVAADAKTITDVLGKGKPDKKGVSKAKAAALMVVAYAQGAMAKDGAKAAELAALRDRAMAVAQAIKDDKFDEAKKLAAGLKAGGVTDPAAKTDPVDVTKLFDLEELMSQFKPADKGGVSLEKNLTKFWNKRGSAPFTAAEVKELVPLLQRTAVMAQVTEAMTPAADEGKKTKAAWVKWSKEMGELAEEATKQARAEKQDGKALRATLKKLEGNCTACHNVFRTE